MKILVLCLPGIGDALMATPMVRVLRQTHPKATIHVGTMFSSVSYIFKNNKYIDDVHYLPLYNESKLKGLQSIFSLRKNNYDVSILAFPAFRREYHIVQWLIGAKKRIAHVFPKGYWSELNFFDTHHIPVNEQEHNVINNLNLLRSLGISWEEKIQKKDIEYELLIEKEDTVYGKEYIKNLGWESGQIVAMHPGSINSPAGILRRWPIERFAKLARFLIKEKKQKILIFLGPFESELGEKLVDLIDDTANCKFISNVPFNKSVGILSNVGLLISNDNGFAHIANALRIKTIVLFGPTNMNLSKPYDAKITICIRKAKFDPWFKNSIKVTNIPHDSLSGMELITVEDVIASINTLMVSKKKDR